MSVSGRVERLGPFSGVTISIKDVIDVAELATTHSSKALADNVAVVDAPLVLRLRHAGFIVLGKTNVPEFPIGHHIGAARPGVRTACASACSSSGGVVTR